MDFTKDDTIRPKKIDNKNNVCVSESTLCQGPTSSYSRASSYIQYHK